MAGKHSRHCDIQGMQAAVRRAARLPLLFALGAISELHALLGLPAREGLCIHELEAAYGDYLIERIACSCTRDACTDNAPAIRRRSKACGWLIRVLVTRASSLPETQTAGSAAKVDQPIVLSADSRSGQPMSSTRRTSLIDNLTLITERMVRSGRQADAMAMLEAILELKKK